MRLNVRRGAIAGLVLSIVLSAGAAARSTDQLHAFAMTLAVTVTASLIVLASCWPSIVEVGARASADPRLPGRLRVARPTARLPERHRSADRMVLCVNRASDDTLRGMRHRLFSFGLAGLALGSLAMIGSTAIGC